MAEKVMELATFTPGPWSFACDSYGKVRHSKKACVFTTVKGAGGDRLVTVAAGIENWDDARLIAKAPALLSALRRMLDCHQAAMDAHQIVTGKSGRPCDCGACDEARAAIAEVA